MGKAKVTVSVSGKPTQTLMRHKKNLRGASMSKTQIIKNGLLSKTELEAAIASGTLEIIRIGKSIRVTEETLRNYL